MWAAPSPLDGVFGAVWWPDATFRGGFLIISLSFSWWDDMYGQILSSLASTTPFFFSSLLNFHVCPFKISKQPFKFGPYFFITIYLFEIICKFRILFQFYSLSIFFIFLVWSLLFWMLFVLFKIIFYIDFFYNFILLKFFFYQIQSILFDCF